MLTDWIKNYINEISKLLEKPPYLVFLFISSIFVLVSLISQKNLETTWVFFLYSVGGTMWRYIERDFFRPLENYPSSRLIIIILYHAGNIFLFWALLHYLNFI